MCPHVARELVSRARVQRASTHVSIYSHTYSRSRTQDPAPKHTSVTPLKALIHTPVEGAPSPDHVLNIFAPPGAGANRISRIKLYNEDEVFDDMC